MLNKITAIIITAAIISPTANIFSQSKKSNNIIKWTTWTLVQAIPSPSFFQDRNENKSRLQFGFSWNVTPINYSFNTNKFISPVSIFMVNPLHRFSGSAELFIQPEWTTSGYQYNGLKRFAISGGARIYIPAIEFGEYLAFSAGGKYTKRNNVYGDNKDSFGIEFGTYTLFGILGAQFDYNFTNETRFNFKITLRYY